MSDFELGKVYKNSIGCECAVVAYDRYSKITIRFLDRHGHIMTVTGCQLKSGHYKNPYYPSRYSVGYIGHGSYAPTVNRRLTSAYTTWVGMLARCYSIPLLKSNPTYVNCSVAPVWHNFQVFAEWYERQDKPRCWQLDKDILVATNRVYSPETCRLVPQEINNLIVSRLSSTSDLPVGVSQSGDRYSATVTAASETAHLGTYDTPLLAFAAYRRARKQHIKTVADKYKADLDPEVYSALMSYEIPKFN